ncbi:MAG: FAD-dependent oxidoreductase [Gammaproteobacteria bacterium]|nr:FAD-dependent oxidoreductase [Gammaproteobacteria bacterium]
MTCKIWWGLHSQFRWDRTRIVILGAGPTGLGAANRLRELEWNNFVVYEKESHAGGLASSFVDSQGFTWDVGGHVQFSHYRYFDNLMDSLLPDEWLHHERESWIWIRELFVPYPFQNNIRRLPRKDMVECLRGLIQVATQSNHQKMANFEEWIQASFGEGIAKTFMMPYNFKVWAYPAREMAYQWVGERVAKVDLERVVMNILDGRDDPGWGPNNTFRFPLRGGTGETWRRLARRFSEGQICFRKTVTAVDTAKKIVNFSDGTKADYDILISTLPLDVLVQLSDIDALKPVAKRLRFSTVHVVGVGLDGVPPPHLQKKCWMYFPEDSSPYYRATVFSNYSPNNVARPGEQWSLMLEVSESPCKAVPREALVESVIEGLEATRMLPSRRDIVSTWHFTAQRGYPTPSLERDTVVNHMLPELETRCVFSRGRFGAWKYEVSNQDHSLMQGVELIDRLAGQGEEETLWKPEIVNSRKKSESR